MSLVENLSNEQPSPILKDYANMPYTLAYKVFVLTGAETKFETAKVVNKEKWEHVHTFSFLHDNPSLKGLRI